MSRENKNLVSEKTLEKTIASKIARFLTNPYAPIYTDYGCDIHKLYYGLRVDGVVVYVGEKHYVYLLDRCNNRPLYERLAKTLATDIKTGAFSHALKPRLAA